MEESTNNIFSIATQKLKTKGAVVSVKDDHCLQWNLTFKQLGLRNKCSNARTKHTSAHYSVNREQNIFEMTFKKF